MKWNQWDGGDKNMDVNDDWQPAALGLLMDVQCGAVWVRAGYVNSVHCTTLQFNAL